MSITIKAEMNVLRVIQARLVLNAYRRVGEMPSTTSAETKAAVIDALVEAYQEVTAEIARLTFLNSSSHQVDKQRAADWTRVEVRNFRLELNA